MDITTIKILVLVVVALLILARFWAGRRVAVVAYE